MSLTTSIKTIQDIMRKDVGVNGDAQRVEQLVWMLFLKILDVRETQKLKETPKYDLLIKDEFRWSNWAVVSKDEKEEKDSTLNDFIDKELFPYLQDESQFGGDSRLKTVIAKIFSGVRNYMRSGKLIRDVIDKIEESIKLDNFKDRQHLGDVYEKLLKDLQAAGNAGEFYTPRAVTEFIVDRIAPRKGESVLDPACGTGGFLAQAVDFVVGKKKDLAEFNLGENIRGIEKKPFPHMLAVTNMILHGIEEPYYINHDNTLELYKEWPDERKVDIVISNPPFGGMEEDKIEKDFPKDYQTRETADLFIHFIYEKMLKDNGRCAIVLPDGFLFGEGIKSRIKEDLMQKCNLHTIVRLPNGVFNPYTGIKSNLLFFKKGEPTETVWFYEHPYPQGYKNYSKTRPMKFSEFKTEREWWGDLYDCSTYGERKDSEFAWKIDFKKEKEEALAKAEPFYEQQRSFEKEKVAVDRKRRKFNKELRELKSDLKKETVAKAKAGLKTQLEKLEESIKSLDAESKSLDQKAKEAQSSGDRIKYDVYNLDRKNPINGDGEVLDPDKLLQEYRQLDQDIDELRELLKNELSALLEV